MSNGHPAGISTRRLTLEPATPEAARAQIDAASPEDRAQVSPWFISYLETAREPNPWMLGFVIVHSSTGATVGSCGFKGPPQADGIVEIAYGIHAGERGKGYATEAAQALLEYAFRDQRVGTVRAHTFADGNASARVLTKCGFQPFGQVEDAEDGIVWRWEITRSLCAKPV